MLITTSLEFNCINYFEGKNKFCVCFTVCYNNFGAELEQLSVAPRLFCYDYTPENLHYRRKGCLEDLRFLN